MSHKWTTSKTINENGKSWVEGKSIQVENMTVSHMERALKQIYRRFLILDEEFDRRGLKDLKLKIQIRTKELLKEQNEKDGSSI